jgi:hypothetical protein
MRKKTPGLTDAQLEKLWKEKGLEWLSGRDEA